MVTKHKLADNAFDIGRIGFIDNFQRVFAFVERALLEGRHHIFRPEMLGNSG